MKNKLNLAPVKSHYPTEEYINRLHGLSQALESNDEAAINALVEELTTLRESALYHELGLLTREIHDTINSFGSDDRIVALAAQDIPDAKERLNFILTKTEEAAHQTMSAAEQTLVLTDRLSKSASELGGRVKKSVSQPLSQADASRLNDDLLRFFESIEPDTKTVNDKMTVIMLAQEYQDITGQMIKQVVTMVQEVEEKLVRLVAISGQTLGEKTRDNIEADGAQGPQLPSANKSKVATSQGDVDDLLASLGF